MQIDLNADLGESFGSWTLGDDDAMLDVVTSANVACGFHAGDPTALRHSCEGAAARGVAIGAQVGYRDLAGFGRRFIDIAPAELTDDVLYQIGALEAFAKVAGTRVRYVKPHGALYNAIVHHEEQAAAVVAAVVQYDPTLPVLGLPGSAWLRLAGEAGLTTEVQRLGIERAGEDAAARGGRSRPHRGQPWHAQDPTECRRALLMWGARSTLPSRSWHPFRHLRQRAELGIRFIEGRPLQRSPFRLFGPCPKSQTATSSLPCPSAM